MSALPALGPLFEASEQVRADLDLDQALAFDDHLFGGLLTILDVAGDPLLDRQVVRAIRKARNFARRVAS